MIALLLHMHQPDYRDPRTGVPTMPWVRLHASRGYRDVPALALATGARVTVNLVPSLIDQWEHYRAGGTDAHLALAERDADTLEPHEVAWLLANFFHGAPASFGWFPAWGALRARGEARGPFSVAALRDVQVWSNLAWFGSSALRDHPELRELRRKATDFTEGDKLYVLEVQASCLRDLPALYRALPDVSCTPYNHPILPLLVDTAHARRCMPGVPDPGYRHPEDALDQLVRGKRRVEEWIGRPVRGLWPSEGSVSPEVVALAAQAGFRWLATDEAVLGRSERDGAPRIDGPWDLGGVRGLFRDHALSDRIGFAYADWRGEEAAQDLLSRIDGPRLIALDGENPWESYRDAGEHFLRTVFASARLRTCSDMAEDAPVGVVRQIHTGSWIGADFAIWIGHPEDRDAWALLRDARAAWEAAGRPEAAREHLYAAMGSDWFWWYGDQFSTPFEAEFDRLFRARLTAAWDAMGLVPPPELLQPIKRSAQAVTPPRAELAADGGDWFAWAGAGRVELRAGAMAPVSGVPGALLYGRRNGRLALRLVPDSDGWSANGVAFVEGRATLPLTTSVTLDGPGGLRLPDGGAYTLSLPESTAQPER